MCNNMSELNKFWHDEVFSNLETINFNTDSNIFRIEENCSQTFKLDYNAVSKLGSDLNLCFSCFVTIVKLIVSEFTNQKKITAIIPVDRKESNVDYLYLYSELYNSNFYELVKHEFEMLNNAYECKSAFGNSLKSYHHDIYFYTNLMCSLNNSRSINHENERVIEFNLCINEEGECYCTIFYNACCFNEKRIDYLGRLISYIYEQVIQNVNITPKEIVYMLPDHVIGMLNKSKGDISVNDRNNIVELIEYIARNNVNNIAVNCIDWTPFTYFDLKELSDIIAWNLSENNIVDGANVILILEKTPKLIACIIAVLKCGGSFQLFDPTMPVEYIKNNSVFNHTSYIVSEANLLNTFSILNCRKISIDDIIISRGKEQFITQKTDFPLAYTINTSGTSGQRKVIQISHKSLINHTKWIINELKISDKDNILQRTPFSFDPSISEIFRSLLSGATLYLYPRGKEKDLDYLVKYININKITVLDLVPSFLEIFIEYIKSKSLYSHLKSLRAIVVGGERLNVDTIRNFNEILYEKCGTVLLYTWGATEVTIDSIYCFNHDFNEMLLKNTMPIGKPINNVQVYILDENMRLKPEGAIGELYIGGVGLGKYLNESLNGLQFVKCQIDSNNNILYKTGDLCKWDNGFLVYMGRIDDQIKIRGVRIDANQILEVIKRHKKVSDAIVVKQNNNDNEMLVAYVILRDKSLSERELKKYCQDYIPSYMLPDIVVFVDSFPINNNEKIDYNTLSEMCKYSLANSAERGTVEKYVHDVFCSLLGLKNISDNESFFSIGGHSLLAIKLVTLINNKYNIGIKYEQLINIDTIRALSDYINQRIDSFSRPLCTSKEENSYSKILNDVEEIFCNLLSLNNVSKSESFFNLGGHSLIGIKLISLLNAKFGIKLNYEFLIENSSIKLISDHINSLMLSSYIADYKDDNKQYYPLSISQRNIWNASQHEDANIAYNMPVCIKIDANVDCDIFKQTINELFILNPVLCTRIIAEDDNVLQTYEMLKGENFLIVEDYLSQSYNIFRGQLYQIMKDFSLYKFQLMNSNLIIIKLLRLKDCSMLLINMHHIISDEWSIRVLLSDLKNIYASILGNTKQLVKTRFNGFRDYCILEFKNNINNNTDAKEYWKEKLGQQIIPIELPYKNSKLDIPSYLGDTLCYSLDKDTIVNLNTLKKQTNSTQFLLAASIFCFIFSKYIRSKDIFIGFVYNNRGGGEYYDQIGLFIRTLLLRVNVNYENDFQSLVMDVKEDFVKSLKYCNFPYENYLSDKNRKNAFNVLIEYHNYQGVIDFNDENIEYTAFERLDYENSTSFNDINIILLERDENFEMIFRYNSDKYEKFSINELGNHFTTLVNTLVKSVNTPLREKTFLSCYDKDIIRNLNSNFKSNEYPLMVHHYIERLAYSSAKKTAIIEQGENITYEELYNKSCLIGKSLSKHKKKNIGVFMERGGDTIASVLGIWMANSIYVPIDTKYPSARIRNIVINADIDIIITNSKYDLKWLIEINPDIIILNFEDLDGTESIELGINVEEASAAYIIYTSGSTGKPKGVIVNHSGMINHLNAKISELGISSESIVAQNSSQCFDISIWQMFAPLMVGGSVLIVPDSINIEPLKFIQYIDIYNCTLLEVVPSYLSLILYHIKKSDVAHLGNLSYLIVTGEKVNKEIVNRWLDIFPSIPIVNAYGPTEASDDVTHHFMRDKVLSCNVPIGKPIQNVCIYILDEFNNICPSGVIGEIAVVGIAVGAGYYKDNKSTRKFFGDNLFTQGDRYYKTGDLGRVNHDGILEIYARIDDQIKINGNRIEIEEISNTVLSYPGVNEAIVLPVDINDSIHLVCFIKLEKNVNSFNIEFLKKAVTDTLPSFMIPSYYSIIQQVPLTENGKIDKNNIVEEFKKSYLEPTAVTNLPQNDTEHMLADIFTDVLPTKKIDVIKGFFEMGGNSILAIKALNLINTEFRTSISMKEFYEFSSIRDLSELLKNRVKTLDYNIYKLHKRNILEKYKLSPIQYPEWFLQKLNPLSTFYNIPFVIKMSGDLRVDYFYLAHRYLIGRHDIFKISYTEVEGIPYQEYSEKISFDLDEFYVDISSVENNTELLNEMLNDYGNIKFDFKAKPYLFKLIKYSENKYYYVFVIHHMIWDQISTLNFAKEIEVIYNEILESKDCNKISLPPLAFNYIDYTEWLNSLVETDKLESQKQFWINKFKKKLEPLNLPFDNPRPNIQTFNGKLYTIKIAPEKRLKISQFAIEQNTTIQMFLLSILNLLIFRITGQKDFVVGTPIWNRDSDDLEPILGLFAAALPIRCSISSEWNFMSLLKETIDSSIDAYDNHLYPFNKVIEEIETGSDFSRQRIISVFFGVQNDDTPLKKFKLNGIEIDDETFNVGLEIADTSVFDFTLQVDHTDEVMYFTLRYNSDLFLKESAEDFLNRYVHLIDQVISDPNRNIINYDIKLSNDISLLINNEEFNLEYSNHNIVDLIYEITNSYPNLIAIEDESGCKMTYSSFKQNIEEIAKYLYENNIRSQDNVGVIIKPSIDYILYILALIRINATFIPLSDSLPSKRIQEILNTNVCNTIIYNSEQANVLEGLTNKPTTIDVSKRTQLHEMSQLPLINVEADDISYIIFTSGSTGAPKGVKIKNKSILNLLTSTTSYFKPRIGESILFYTSVLFDASLMDYIWPLTFGGKVYVKNVPWNKSIKELINTIKKNKIDHIQMSPLLLDSLLDYFNENENEIIDINSIARIVVGGDMFYKHTLDRYFEILNIDIYNCYGPTETTVDVTRYKCNPFEHYNNIVPVGEPISSTAVYILDDYENVCPIGIPGNVFISSIGNSPGYINNENETCKSFIYNEKLNVNLYRTGDYGVILRTGNLVILGRIDKQVKINGYRIELQEIEKCIKSITEVSNSVVVKEMRGKSAYLRAYIELKNSVAKSSFINSDISIDQTYISNKLSEVLPNYMIPNVITFVEKIPINSSGKNDIDKLTNTNNKNCSLLLDKKFTKEQNCIKNIFSRISHLDDLHLDSNFFDIGGNSINLLRAISFIEDQFNVKLSVREFIANSTIRKLTEYLMNQKTHKKYLYTLKQGFKNRLICIPSITTLSNDFDFLVETEVLEYNCFCLNLSFLNNYKISKIDLLNTYFNEILASAGEGKVNLLGYSIGGGLSLKLAQMLERQNRLGKLLLIDFDIVEKVDYSKNANSICLDGNDESLSNRMCNYCSFISEINIDNIMLNTDIEVLYSDTFDKRNFDYLKKVTNKRVIFTKLKGMHNNLLQEDHILVNAKKIISRLKI